MVIFARWLNEKWVASAFSSTVTDALSFCHPRPDWSFSTQPTQTHNDTKRDVIYAENVNETSERQKKENVNVNVNEIENENENEIDG
jgi:hypothetical protein